MKVKALTAIISLAVLLSLALSIPCHADGITDIITEYNGSESLQTFTENYLPENVGSTSEWYVFALSYDQNADLAAYRGALRNYLTEKKVSSASTRLKFALAFIASGDREEPYIKEVLESSVGSQGIMSLSFGLHIYNNIGASAESVNGVISDVLSLEKADGGWAVTGNYADPDVTAMTIQALAPYYGENASVTAAVDRAVSRLSLIQKDNGSFASYGAETSESCSQVIIALRSLGIDPDKDERFIKNGSSVCDALMRYKNTDGSFAHVAGGESNSLATAQAFCALTAMSLHDGQNIFFVFDIKEDEPPVTGDGEEDPGKGGESTDKPSDDPKPTDETKPDEPSETPDNTDGGDESDKTADRNKPSYKVYVSIGIVALGVIASVILIILKKRNKLNFIFIAAVVAVLLTIVLITDISSKEDYYKAPEEPVDAIGSVTVSIDCKNIPDGYVILEPSEYPISAGETVYDLLIKAAREHSILIDSSGAGSLIYIAGIASVYEYEHGELSGWMYLVNGESPSVGCASYVLEDGDVVEWRYTLNIGNDLQEADE